jgi:hypothetical protein
MFNKFMIFAIYLIKIKISFFFSILMSSHPKDYIF